MDIQTKEALSAEIEQFKEEALKMHIVQVLADTYTKTNLFDYNIINFDGSVIWYKAQARQLWDFWKAAQAQAVPEPSIDLTGHDIKFITNFMCYSDLDNLDTEVTIQKCKSGFDGAGLYAWVAEYPEEGGIKLGEAQEQSHD